MKKLTHKFYIKEVDWANREPELRLIRHQVFIVEQHVPEILEWDAHDVAATHLLAVDNTQQAIACARILRDGSIGRMAVVKHWRNSGVGRALLDHAIAICQAWHCKQITLSAQVHAVSFYQKSGFVVCSEPYLDANIQHVDMQLDIRTEIRTGI